MIAKLVQSQIMGKQIARNACAINISGNSILEID